MDVTWFNILASSYFTMMDIIKPSLAVGSEANSSLLFTSRLGLALAKEISHHQEAFLPEGCKIIS